MNLQRRLVSWKTLKSWQSIPHAAYNYQPDVTEFMKVFNELNEGIQQKDAGLKGKKAKYTLNTVLLKLIANALEKAPDMNATCTYDLEKKDGQIVILDHVDIDVPWILPGGGMLTLTVRDVHKKSLAEIAETIQSLKQKVLNTDIELFYKALVASFTEKNINLPSDSLQLTDIASGTITVSNLGSISHSRGYVTLLDVLEPQVCAIGISSVQEEPAVFTSYSTDSMGSNHIYGDIDGATVGKKIGIRKILPMCIAMDHRALDFGQVVPFLEYMDSVFENPEVIKSW